MQEVLSHLLLLGEKNGTRDLVDGTWEFIKRNIDNFNVDFNNTSRKERYSSGKLEDYLFLQLAAICNYENGNNNAKMSSKIMIEVGYNSYAERPNRFRQKVENLKKKRKKKYKPSRRRRHRQTRLVIDYESTVSDYADSVVESANDMLSSCGPNSPTETVSVPVHNTVVGESTVSSVIDNSNESGSESSWRRLEQVELDKIIAQQLGYDDKDTFLGHDVYCSTFEEGAIFEGFMPDLF